jgi:hypothetical protein
MPFSEHLKPPPKQAPLPWPLAIAVWLAMGLGNWFFYAWLSIAVEGSRSSLSNPGLTVSAMQTTALAVSAVSLCFFVFRMQRSALATLALVLPLAFASVWMTR